MRRFGRYPGWGFGARLVGRTSDASPIKWPRGKFVARGQLSDVRSIDSYRFGRGVGLPVVAGASSAIQVVALRSYLRPFAAFRASLVAFITR